MAKRKTPPIDFTRDSFLDLGRRRLRFEVWSQYVREQLPNAKTAMFGDLVAYGLRQSSEARGFAKGRARKFVQHLKLDRAAVKEATQIQRAASVAMRARFANLKTEHWGQLVKAPKSELGRWAEEANERKANPEQIRQALKAGKWVSRDEVERKTGTGSKVPSMLALTVRLDRKVAELVKAAKGWKREKRARLAAELISQGMRLIDAGRSLAA